MSARSATPPTTPPTIAPTLEDGDSKTDTDSLVMTLLARVMVMPPSLVMKLLARVMVMPPSLVVAIEAELVEETESLVVVSIVVELVDTPTVRMSVVVKIQPSL